MKDRLKVQGRRMRREMNGMNGYELKPKRSTFKSVDVPNGPSLVSYITH